MKAGGSADSNRTFRIGGTAINLQKIWGKPLGFVLLAFVIGATISQGSFAFADDSSTNPFRAIWDAIGELQTKTDTLQAQIDDLKAQRGTISTASEGATKTSDGSVAIEVSGGEDGQTIITFFVRNSGPDSAVGAKLTAFYETSLLRINFIEGADCTDGSRGIVECYLGTIEEGSDAKITIDADPISLDQTARIIAEFSSITRDANPADNHTETVFVTAITPVAQPTPSAPSGGSGSEEQPAAEEQGAEQTGEEQTEPAEQPQEGEQAPEEGTGEAAEQSGEESTSEQSEGTESAGDQGESTGEAGTEEGASGEESAGEGSGDATGEGAEESSGDTGSGEGGESGDAGSSGEESASSDGGSGDTGAGDSGGDAGESGGSGDTGSGSDGGSTSDGGSGDGGSDGGDSGSSSGESGGSEGGDSGSTGGNHQQVVFPITESI